VCWWHARRKTIGPKGKWDKKSGTEIVALRVGTEWGEK